MRVKVNGCSFETDAVIIHANNKIVEIEECRDHLQVISYDSDQSASDGNDCKIYTKFKEA